MYMYHLNLMGYEFYKTNFNDPAANLFEYASRLHQQKIAKNKHSEIK